MVGVSELVTCASTLGTEGAVVSTVTVNDADAEEMLPAASDAVAEIACAPSLSAELGVKVQVPAPPTVAVPSRVGPS